MPREADPKFKGMDNQGSTLSAPAVLGDAFDFTQEQVPIRWRSGAKKGAQAPAFDGNSNSEAVDDFCEGAAVGLCSADRTIRLVPESFLTSADCDLRIDWRRGSSGFGPVLLGAGDGLWARPVSERCFLQRGVPL